MGCEQASAAVPVASAVAARPSAPTATAVPPSVGNPACTFHKSGRTFPAQVLQSTIPCRLRCLVHAVLDCVVALLLVRWIDSRDVV